MVDLSSTFGGLCSVYKEKKTFDSFLSILFVWFFLFLF